MQNKILKTCAFFLSVFVVILSIKIDFNELAFAKSNNQSKIYCEATIEDEFADNRVLVVLNETKSGIEKNYKSSDFNEIKCKKVKNIKFKKQKNNGKENKRSRNILSIELEENSKEYVLKAIVDAKVIL